MNWTFRSWPKEWHDIPDLTNWLESRYPDTAKMPNLASLIKRCNMLKMKAALEKLFDDDRKAARDHLKVFEQLSYMVEKMPWPLPESGTIITAIASLDEETGLYSKNSDVSGVKKGDDTSYALELSPWDEWLSYKVIPENAAGFESIEDYVASIIWEMTFLGFSEEAIHGKAAKMQDNARSVLENLLPNITVETQENSFRNRVK